jgi:hypothetical protein
MYFQFTHHIKQHNTFAYLNVKATLLRHITKTFLYPHTFQHQCTPHRPKYNYTNYKSHTSTTACSLTANAILLTCIAKTYYTHSHIYMHCPTSIKAYCWDYASSPKVLYEEAASAEAVRMRWPKDPLHEASELQTDLKVEWPFSP